MAASDARGAPGRRFEKVGDELRIYLRRRYRLLANEHDDLLQQTLSDLFEATRTQASPLPDGELSALAHSILKRRIVDRFRREARSVVEHVEPDAVPEAHDEGTFVARMHYRRLLRAVLHLIDELNPEQRALLLEETLPDAQPHVAHTAAQRQQLKRLREGLRARLSAEYGIRLDEDLGG